MANDTGATASEPKWLATDQTTTFQAPFTIELYFKPDKGFDGVADQSMGTTSLMGSYARFLTVAPNEESWIAGDDGFSFWDGNGNGKLHLFSNQSRILSIENFDYDTNIHFVLTITSSKIIVYYKADGDTSFTTVESTSVSNYVNNNEGRYITIGMDPRNSSSNGGSPNHVGNLSNYTWYSANYYYLRVWDSTALNADEVETLYTHREQIGWDAVVAALSPDEPEPEPEP